VIKAEKAEIAEETDANKEVFAKNVVEKLETFDPMTLKPVEMDQVESELLQVDTEFFLLLLICFDISQFQHRYSEIFS
jgi:hypothetical protein